MGEGSFLILALLSGWLPGVLALGSTSLSPCARHLRGQYNPSSEQVDITFSTSCYSGSTLLVGGAGSHSSCTRLFSEELLVFSLPASSPMAEILQAATLTLSLLDMTNPGSMTVTLCSLGLRNHSLASAQDYHGDAGCRQGETLLEAAVFHPGSAAGEVATVNMTDYVRQLYESGGAAMGAALHLRLGSSVANGCGTSCSSTCAIKRYRIHNTVALELDVGAPGEGVSSWVSPGPCGLEYTEADNGDRIPDFSHAGFMSGEQALPVAPVRESVAPCSAGVDCTSTIQDAIDKVSAMPITHEGLRGAVFLQAGVYEVGSTLYIQESGVVLRGAGRQSADQGGTVLIATAPVQYSTLEVGSQDGGSATEVAGTRVPIVDSYVPIGAISFQVSSAASFAVGDDVIVLRPGTSQWIAAIGMDRIVDCFSPSCVNWTASTYDLKFERKVLAVEGDLVTLDVPLVQPMSAEYGGGYLYKYTFPTRLSNSGVEDIRFDSVFASPTDEAHAWSAVYVDRLQHGWVQRVSCIHYGFACVNVERRAKYITVSDCHSWEMISIITGGRRYTFNVVGQMVLVTGCSASDGRHDYVTSSRVSGPNVFHNCTATSTHSDIGPHHRWGVGQLYDRIVSDGEGNVWNRGNAGSGHGWSGAQVVFWNSVFSSMLVEAAPGSRNWAIGCMTSTASSKWSYTNGSARIDATSSPPRGGVAGVVGEWDLVNQAAVPASLYASQLQSRLSASCATMAPSSTSASQPSISSATQTPSTPRGTSTTHTMTAPARECVRISRSIAEFYSARTCN